MADVFVSYANQDRGRAHDLANALEARGWSVWWDRKIVAGQTFDQVIEHELESARCVVVLWSRHSVSSEWVKNESSDASERGVLVPALIDPVKPPLEFRRKQNVDLAGWSGDTSSEGFEALCRGIAATTKTPAAPPHRAAVSQESRRSWGVRWTQGVMVLAMIAVGWVVYQGLSGSSESAAELGIKVPAERYSTVVKAVPAGGHGIDTPVLLYLDETYKVTLEKNGERYFKLSSPASNLKILLDMRQSDDKYTNLQSTLSILDQDGAVLKGGAIGFNEIDVGYRKTAVWSATQPTILGFKILNTSSTANFWLTVLEAPASRLIPFFGELVPTDMTPQETASGVLDNNKFVYYKVSLPKGDHKVILDFSNSGRAHTNIQGYLAVLDAYGGARRNLIGLNEIGVSHRSVAKFSLKQDQPLIVKIHNQGSRVDYRVKIVPDA
jgi:hypothetical protein